MSGRDVTKGPDAFRTISEASTELGVPQHVLRFWETKFSFIRPMKRAGGRRFYRRQDLAVLRAVRTLLHDEGYTIKGVQRLHKEHGVHRLIGAGEGDMPPRMLGESVAQNAAERAADLFDQAAEPAPVAQPSVELFHEDRIAAPEPLLAQPAAFAAEPVLQAPARARLEAVLRDIEAVKAGIDRLLQESDG